MNFGSIRFWILFSLVFLLITHSEAKRRVRVDLYQSDFDKGTYRILESGVYHIREDINFGPLPENDYWNDPADRNYPIANYYMGFFAAITVEADNVEIDLHGHTIQQTEAFYLMQRFYNTIELNDKVFVHNEGVGALNYQNYDNVTYAQSHVVGDLVTVRNVVIKNGVLGRTSHIGIHGNGAHGVTIKNVEIRDFEVAGIQCNGCKRVIIDRCQVGPSSREVPAVATFSNARFMDLFVNRIIPYGFARDTGFSDDLLALLNEEITFADRTEPVTIQSVFDRLAEAIDLYTQYKWGTLPTFLTESQEALLEEALKVFANPTGLPDGSVLYGILINKLGIPHSDDNFYGSGYESGDVVIKSTDIIGLHARPLQVPGLKTVGGDFIQGTARDVFRIFDVVSDQFRTLTRSRYSGNFLSDTYLAMWKLSNGFYTTRIYDSECGNFGTNATMPYNINPLHADQCLGGTKRDPSITGRMATLFNKRYFGGLVMSQGVYDWATTPGMGLDQILASKISAPELRMTKHYIDCGGDTMFHPMQGVIGLKIIETKDVVIKRVSIKDLYNIGDNTNWVCNQKWKLPSTGEVIMPQESSNMQGSFIRGVQIVKSDNIEFSRVDIKDLYSEEGNVYGVQIRDDLSDRTDYENGHGIEFQRSFVSNLTSGGFSTGFDSQGSAISASRGLVIGDHEELHNGFINPKTSVTYGFSYREIPDASLFPGIYPFDNIFGFAKNTSKFDTTDKLLEFRNKGFQYFETYYGLKFTDYENAELDDEILVYHPDGTLSDSLITWFAYGREMEYHTINVCHENTCSDILSSITIDFGYIVYVGSQGLTLHGTFGGDEGQFAPAYTTLFTGVYSIENVEVNGHSYDNIEIEYFPVCPITSNLWSDNEGYSYNLIINCELESPLFGKGSATGSLQYYYAPATDEEEPYWNVTGYSVMVFDDMVDFPEESGIHTDLANSADLDFPKTLFSVWADGGLKSDTSFHLFPLMKSFHFLDESAIRYFKEHTSLNTDEEIFALRKRFLTRLRDEYGITVNPDGFDNIPLDAVVDLGGGGNRVQAYEVNDLANFRILTRADSATGTAAGLPKGSRVREVGFRLVFGRSGLNTRWGHLPQGTMLSEGIYVLENTEGIDSKIEVQFHSEFPLISDWWSSGVISNVLDSDVYGKGLAQMAVTMPKEKNGKHYANVRGTMHFD